VVKRPAQGRAEQGVGHKDRDAEQTRSLGEGDQGSGHERNDQQMGHGTGPVPVSHSIKWRQVHQPASGCEEGRAGEPEGLASKVKMGTQGEQDHH
jgi:hypothetical protein